ncbi:MAG: hypothetical protein HYR94_27140 [Chloroflexi bacterium]|nr:hypothetical protein [Chloroflexota bacterium]
MIYSYEINGLPVQTGDLICTSVGQAGYLAGEWWLFLGNLVPGEVDHAAIYVGPKGRCVEAEPRRGVITFELKDNLWQVEKLLDQRQIIDRCYGVAYPLQGQGLSRDVEMKIRRGVATYCLAQAAAGKPYNFNFFDSDTESSFYCSQLLYKAYLLFGINLNTGLDVPEVPGSQAIIFPQEIWSGCAHRRATGACADEDFCRDWGIRGLKTKKKSPNPLIPAQ